MVALEGGVFLVGGFVIALKCFDVYIMICQ